MGGPCFVPDNFASLFSGRIGFPPRFLDYSFGIAEPQNSFKRTLNGSHKQFALPSWNNTELEEFDWAQVDRKRRRIQDNSQIYCNTGFPIDHTQPSTTSPQPVGSISGLLNSLLSKGLISLQDKQQPVDDSAVGVLEFDPARLKVRNESVITALYSYLSRQCSTCGCRFLTKEEHSKHMDWHLNKNRSMKNRKTKPSATWFVSSDLWVRALEMEVPAGDTKVDDVEVPADDGQPACALCRERFEDYYSHETDLWMFKGAVYMYGPAGGDMGAIDDKSKLGPIIHAKCVRSS